MKSRVSNDVAGERHTALTQIGLIGGYRLADVVASPPAAEAAAMAERLTAETAADRTAALLREWMLAASLDVYQTADNTGEFLGVHAKTTGSPSASPQHMLVGIYSDPTTQDLRRDGCFAPVLGIAVAQHLRQQQTPTRLDLLVLASPASSQPGSVLLRPSQPALRATDIDTLAALRAAGITGHCLTVVHVGAALPEGNAATIDRAVRTLEHILT